MNASAPFNAWDHLSTEERVALIRPLWVEGHSASAIRRMIGAPTRNVIIGLVHRHINNVERERLPAHARIVSRRQAPMRSRKFTRIPFEAPRPARKRRAAEAPDLGSPPATGSVAFLDRHSAQCAFPYGDPSERMLVCGGPVKEGRPYCPAHCRIVYVAVKSDGKLRNNHYTLVAR